MIPRVQGLLDPVQESADWVSERRHELMAGAGQAILAAIRTHNAKHPQQQRDESRVEKHDHFAPAP